MPPAYTVRFRLMVRKKRDVSPPGGMNASPTVFFATFPKQPDKHQFVVLLSKTDKHFMFYPEGIP